MVRFVGFADVLFYTSVWRNVILPVMVVFGIAVILGAVKDISRARKKDIDPRERKLSIAGAAVKLILLAVVSSPFWLLPLIKRLY